jgi:indolepyruvate ferredoxin oxidoreductase beta subunit
MSENKSILIFGVGGQGTLLASRVLGSLAVKGGFDVKLSEVHGMAQRGGSVVTHVKFGEKIHSPLIEPGKADIILAFEKMEALRWCHFLGKDGIMIVNTQEIDPMPVIIGVAEYPKNILDQLKEKCAKLLTVDALKMASELGNIRVVNTILIGVLSKHIGTDREEWQEAIRETVPKKTVEINSLAFDRGRSI